MGTIQEEKKTKLSLIKSFKQQRYVLVLMAFLGFTFSSILRANINITLVAMVNHTALNQGTDDAGVSEEDDGPYVWDESIQSLILSSFYWGYMVTNIAGGRIAERYGFKHITSIGILVSAIITLVTPISATVSWKLLVALRALMGFVLGPSYPSITVMMAAWIPNNERNRISAIVHNGPYLGCLLASLVTGVVSDTIGWDINYYIMGGLAAVWVIAWELMVYDYPEDHPRISQEELTYIKESMEESHKEKKAPNIPWRKILLSPPVWAIIITNGTFDYYGYFIAMYMPDFFKSMLHMGYDEIGYYLSIGSGLTVAVSFLLAFIADFLTTRKLVTRTLQRKLNTLWIEWGTAGCLVVLCFVEGRGAIIALFLLSQFFSGGGSSGYLINPVDISSNFSGTIFGIANTLSSALGMLTPVITGRILLQGQNQKTWRITFLISAGMNLLGGLIFLVWGTGKEQKWNVIKEEKTGSDAATCNTYHIDAKDDRSLASVQMSTI